MTISDGLFESGFAADRASYITATSSNQLPLAAVVVLYASAAALCLITVYSTLVELLIQLRNATFREVRTVLEPRKVADDIHLITGDGTRADRQPTTHNTIRFVNAPATRSSLKYFESGSGLNSESTVGSSAGYYTGSSNYSAASYRSTIVGTYNNAVILPHTVRSNLQGIESEADRKGCDTRRVGTELNVALQGTEPVISGLGNTLGIDFVRHQSSNRNGYTKTTKLENPDLCKQASWLDAKADYGHEYVTSDQKPIKLNISQTPDSFKKQPAKLTYAVLVGNTVKVYNTCDFASLPHNSKYMVKERYQDTSGVKVKLSLKSTEINRYDVPDDDAVEKDGAGDTYVKTTHFHKNIKCTGYVIYTCDRRFHGSIRYPLPNVKATNSKIGKGGNGFVFTMYHERKHYAVKKTVYRSNEINVHSALQHENILPLLAVLMGEKHERHSGKYYCFHFMPKMDCDLRQILSIKEIGCLKHFYNHCSKEPGNWPWDTAYRNIKFILKETLCALVYLHGKGYVHRDVKASNIMIKMNCKCSPLSCTCISKFCVKLGDYDSAGTVPGLGIKEPTDQMIKFASILPLGTPGYRAPEVSMHIVLSGPYETLYTTAVDMWSFGCLCLNICIGKTAALKQREEASLLLSLSHSCSQELWERTTKIKELQRTKPFSQDLNLIKLISGCLQVKSSKRPSAEKAIELLIREQSSQAKLHENHKLGDMRDSNDIDSHKNTRTCNGQSAVNIMLRKIL